LRYFTHYNIKYFTEAMNRRYNIGCIGYGFVGKALKNGFEDVLSDLVDIEIYDKFQNTRTLEYVVDHSDILFLCLPTPMDLETGECDTSIIYEICDTINKIAKKKLENCKAIVIKSTVTPGTTSNLQKKYPNHTFIHNPEFLREISAYEDFITQDRIVLGLPSEGRSSEFPEEINFHSSNISTVCDFYNDFIKRQAVPGQIYKTGTKESEMLKYIANCFLATKVMFFNEIYEICNASNINFDLASEIACSDKRIGYSHSKVPGPDGQLGVGGKCLIKDLNSLIHFSKELGVDPKILETIQEKNLSIRKNHDWLDIPGATTKNMKYT